MSATKNVATASIAAVETGETAESPLARIAREGAIAGVLGYAVIAAFLGILSLLQGRSPFYVAALLGGELFFPAQGGAVVVSAGPVLAYNGAHLLVFLVAGIGAAALAALVDRAPDAWYVALLSIVFVAAHVLGLPLWFREPVRAVLPLGTVAAATVMATVAMVAYLWRVHPDLKRILRTE